jgi:hypothetical protein
MRKLAWTMLVLLVFTIPWEGSLDFGEPVGTIARIAGVFLLLLSIPAMLQAGRMRTPGALQVLVLVYYLWLCCSFFWSIDSDATLDRMRGAFQVIMIVWLLWELAETPQDLRMLLRAYVAGAWVLSALTIANFFSVVSVSSAADQARFVAEGQDPNDVARFLGLALPMAGLLYDGESEWWGKLLALGYLPVGMLSVVLTASRGGFAGALLALAADALLLLRHRPARQRIAAVCIPVVLAAFAAFIPLETFQRLATLSQQLEGGDLNQRVNIWIVASHVLPQRPFFGAGAGTFVSAAGLSYIDTAHNTMLSLVIEGGIVSLLIAGMIVFLSARNVLRMEGPLRIGLGAALGTFLVSTLDATVEGNRSTWFLFGVIAFAARLATQQPSVLMQNFPAPAAAESSNLRPEAAS